MRIGIEAQRLLRKKKCGIDIVALNLLRHLPAIDPQNEYILFTRNGDDVACLSMMKDVRIVILPSITYADWEQIHLPLAVKRERIDILHCTSSTAPLFISVPTILTVHDIIFTERSFFGDRSQSLYQRLGNAYRTIVSQRAMVRAEKIITVSHFEQQQIIERFPLLRNKVSVIHNGVDTPFFSGSTENDANAIQKIYALPRKYFLHFGNSDPKKNTPFVLRSFISYAAGANTIIPLVVTGIQRASVETLLKQYSAEHLSRYIVTPGYISHHHVPGLYASALALLFPSTRESFGLPILEAMAAGIPVITMDNSSITEVAGDAAFYIRPDDIHELASVMNFIQSEIHPIISQTIRGINRALLFDWKQSARQYIVQFATLRHLFQISQSLIYQPLLKEQ